MKDKDSTFIECGHAFHSRCLQEWIKKSYYCPVCRMKIRGYLNNKDVHEKKIYSKSLSNKSTVFSDLNPNP